MPDDERPTPTGPLTPIDPSTPTDPALTRAPDLPDSGPPRRLAPGQRCRVWIGDRAGAVVLVHENRDVLLEAPNWDRDDRLVLNGDGRLWTLPVDGTAGPTPIPTTGLPPVNNDHVLHPDGVTILVSANDWHLYRVPRAGGVAERITSATDRLHFLHGVSPDGATLAYTCLIPGEGDAGWWSDAHLRLVGLDGTDDRRLTRGGPDDGADYSPDGAWIHLNTEVFTPGRAQIARVRPDGSDLTRLTHDERVHWFPHPAPSGDVALYLAYPPGTQGHPADLDVELVLVDLTDWDIPLWRLGLRGGQGTINVPSWSPDGERFAFVDYPADVSDEPPRTPPGQPR